MRSPKFIGALMASALAALPTIAAAQWWDPQAASMRRPREPEPKIVYREAHIDKASGAIQRALLDGDFDKLERMHDEFLALEAAGGNGKRMLGAFERAFQIAFPRQDEARMRKVLADWEQARPQSALRMAAEAWFWDSLAWKARGGGFASEVAPEAFEAFRQHLRRATEVLAKGEARGKASPVWYSAAIAIAGAGGQPAAVLDGIFEDAARRYPLHLPVYSARLNYLLPQWGGDYERIDAFIRAAVRRTQATEGTTFYSRLYAQVHRSYRGADFFRESKASWAIMRHAYLDALAHEPGDDTLNAFGAMACVAQDRQTTAAVLEQLGPRANLAPGLQDVSTEACVDFAKGGK